MYTLWQQDCWVLFCFSLLHQSAGQYLAIHHSEKNDYLEIDIGPDCSLVHLVTAPGCIPPNALPSPLYLGSSDPSSTSASLLHLSSHFWGQSHVLDLAHHLPPLTELLRLQLLPYHCGCKRKYSFYALGLCFPFLDISGTVLFISSPSAFLSWTCHLYLVQQLLRPHQVYSWSINQERKAISSVLDLELSPFPLLFLVKKISEVLPLFTKCSCFLAVCPLNTLSLGLYSWIPELFWLFLLHS